nr:predicted GPI-anchored protein 58 [Aegilops tauschii subsp. strangulata]
MKKDPPSLAFGPAGHQAAQPAHQARAAPLSPHNLPHRWETLAHRTHSPHYALLPDPIWIGACLVAPDAARRRTADARRSDSSGHLAARRTPPRCAPTTRTRRPALPDVVFPAPVAGSPSAAPPHHHLAGLPRRNVVPILLPTPHCPVPYNPGEALGLSPHSSSARCCPVAAASSPRRDWTGVPRAPTVAGSSHARLPGGAPCLAPGPRPASLQGRARRARDLPWPRTEFCSPAPAPPPPRPGRTHLRPAARARLAPPCPQPPAGFACPVASGPPDGRLACNGAGCPAPARVTPAPERPNPLRPLAQ